MAMSPEYLVLMRLAQLMLGSLIGLASIYFGYKLFAQIPVKVTNDGSFKMPNVGEVKLKVAPGIFFAALGTAIVYFSLSPSVSIKSGLTEQFSPSTSGSLNKTEALPAAPSSQTQEPTKGVT
jgi:hypothetical protein